MLYNVALVSGLQSDLVIYIIVIHMCVHICILFEILFHYRLLQGLDHFFTLRFFFNMDHLKNLCWICYNIASMFWCFGQEACVISLTRDWTLPAPLALERKIFTTGPELVFPGLDSWQHFLWQEMEPEHSPASMRPWCRLQKLWGHLEVLEGQCPMAIEHMLDFLICFLDYWKTYTLPRHRPQSPTSHVSCYVLSQLLSLACTVSLLLLMLTGSKGQLPALETSEVDQ